MTCFVAAGLVIYSLKFGIVDSFCQCLSLSSPPSLSLTQSILGIEHYLPVFVFSQHAISINYNILKEIALNYYVEALCAKNRGPKRTKADHCPPKEGETRGSIRHRD